MSEISELAHRCAGHAQTPFRKTSESGKAYCNVLLSPGICHYHGTDVVKLGQIQIGSNVCTDQRYACTKGLKEESEKTKEALATTG